MPVECVYTCVLCEVERKTPIFVRTFYMQCTYKVISSSYTLD